jgi:prepilin-type N-terminal cleavage/methylation domain-containing protein
MKARRLPNQWGFTLIEILVSLGLMSIVALTVFLLQNYLSSGRASAELAFQANQIRREVLAVLNDSASWKYTLNNNATFSCITHNPPLDCSHAMQNGPPAGTYTYSTLAAARGGCVAGVCNGGFDVYFVNPKTAVATTFYPFMTATAGWTKRGDACNTWNGNNSQCPLRLVLWWRAVCPNTTSGCYSPTIRVKGYMLYAPKSGVASEQVPFKPDDYGVDVILQPNY